MGRVAGTVLWAAASILSTIVADAPLLAGQDGRVGESSLGSGLPGRTLEPFGLPGRRLPGIDGVLPDGTDPPPDGSLLLKEPRTALIALQRRREETERPMEAAVAISALRFQAIGFARSCTAGLRFACEERDDLLGAAARLGAGAAASADCDAAARELSKTYANGGTPDGVAKSYDLACLGSIEARVAPAVVEPAPRPPLLAVAAADPNSGVLAAIGVLEEDGVPFCGALLRPDGTVATARHCLDGKLGRLGKTSLTVRAASGKGGPWRLAAVASRPTDDSDQVASDWIVLRLPAGTKVDAPKVNVASAGTSGPATMVGHYAFSGLMKYATGGPPVWRQGLRYPRDGLCEVVRIDGTCVQLACQTIRGFSGTPVFRASPGADGAPVIVGFVSGEATGGAGCPPVFAGATVAVWAGVVK